MTNNACKTIYLGRTRPLLHSATDYLWQGWTVPDSCSDSWDLSKLLIVLPTARSLRRLSALLDEKAARQSVVLGRPKLITVGELPERLFKPPLPVATELEQTLAWARALALTPDSELTALLTNLPPREPLAPWLDLASTINTLHSDLAAGELDFSAVEKEVAGEAEQRRWRLLSSLHSHYLRELRSAGRVDPFFARSEALKKKRCRSGSDIVLVGTSDLARSVTSLLRAVVDANRVAHSGCGTVTALVAAPDSDRDHFDSFGSIIASQWVRHQLPLRDDQLVAAQDVADQASATADIIESWSSEHPLDTVTIGVTDESLVGPVEFELRSRGLTSYRELGWTVAQTPVGRLLERLADHLSRNSWRSLASLVRHADVYDFVDGALASHGAASTAGSPAERNWLTSLDNLLANHYPTRCDHELPPLAIQACLQAIEVRDLIQRSLRELRGPSRTLSDWAGRVAAWLAGIYHGENGVLRMDPHSRTGQAVETTFTFMHAIQELEVTLDVKVSATSAIELLITRLGQIRIADSARSAHATPAHATAFHATPAHATAFHATAFHATAFQATPSEPARPNQGRGAALAGPRPPESLAASSGNRQPVTISGWLDLALDDSPWMVITSLNHPYVPEAVTADPFLPGSLRTRLQLNDNERRLARDIHALDVILSTRPGVRLIVGARSLDGSPTPPSRLLAAAEPLDAARRLVALLEPAPSASRRVSTPCAPHNNPWQGLAGKSRILLPALPRGTPILSMSVTAFKDYLACPYRFYLRHGLHIKPLDDSSGELQANQFGDLIHNTLDWFGKSDLKDSTSQTKIQESLHQTLDQYATSYFGTTPTAAVRLQIEQARRRLSAVAVAQSERRQAGWNIHDVETPFGESQAAGIDVDGHRMPIRGRIDRIDRHDDGRWAIIDYKTHGHPPRKKHLRYDKDTPCWTDLQLPLYQLLIPFVINDQVDTKSVSLSYFNIGDNLSQTKVNDADFTDREFASAKETIFDCIRRIRRGDFAPSDDVLFDDYWMILQTGAVATLFDRLVGSDIENESVAAAAEASS